MSPPNARLDASATGPILVEGLLQVLCQGVIFAQAIKYYESPLDDTRRSKSYICVLVVLSVFQTALSIYKLWIVLVLGRHWSSSPIDWADLFFNGVICSVSELYLVRRCWKATKKNPWVLLLLGFIAVTTFLANVYLAVEIGHSRLKLEATNDPLRTNRYLPTVISFNYWIFGSLALDITVTSILMVWLWRSKTGLSYLDKAIKHIIGISWESAAVPCVSMVVAVALYHAKPAHERNVVLIFILMTGKYYSLGILRAVNSREKLRQRMHSEDNGRRSLSGWQWDQDNTAATPRMVNDCVAPCTDATSSPSGVADSASTLAARSVEDGGLVSKSPSVYQRMAFNSVTDATKVEVDSNCRVLSSRDGSGMV
ncbi:hypothetical protein OF83DRAFT_1167975 [Amylostereum chailletii]|nr:hypothetical protein OF83DRAFT_1167975 [Amylostereum chailletii]